MLIIGTDTVEFTDVNGELITVPKPYKNAPVFEGCREEAVIKSYTEKVVVIYFDNSNLVIYQTLSPKDTLTIVPQYQLN
jgi:hypothetical protein